MVIWMFPRIAGIKVESSWGHGRRGLVRCTVRLTRNLTAREAERLSTMVDVETDGGRLVYVCRPEEVEEREERLDRALARLARRRTSSLDSARERRGKRSEHPFSPHPSPSPSAS